MNPRQVLRASGFRLVITPAWFLPRAPLSFRFYRRLRASRVVRFLRTRLT